MTALAPHPTAPPRAQEMSPILCQRSHNTTPSLSSPPPSALTRRVKPLRPSAPLSVALHIKPLSLRRSLVTQPQGGASLKMGLPLLRAPLATHGEAATRLSEQRAKRALSRQAHALHRFNITQGSAPKVN